MNRHVAQFTFGVALFVAAIITAIWGMWPLTVPSWIFGTILFGVSFRKD